MNDKKLSTKESSCKHHLELAGLFPETGNLSVVCVDCKIEVLVDSCTLPCFQPCSNPLYGKELVKRVKLEAEGAAILALADMEKENAS